MTALIVIAKECVPGKVKTRLHPPLSLEAAANVARLSLIATLRTGRSVPASRRILFFDGELGDLAPHARGYDVVPQPPGTLDERLGHVFDLVDEPALVIGMDTPQVAPDHLRRAFEEWPHEVDALFGPATDGGFWALGLRRPSGSLIRGVPMSRADTGALQRERLLAAGLVVAELPVLRDIDTVDDLAAVAELVDVSWPTAVRELVRARAGRPATAGGGSGVVGAATAGGASGVAGMRRVAGGAVGAPLAAGAHSAAGAVAAASATSARSLPSVEGVTR
ncbi:TIGR04282 family arsenosugar biosynthesis glycosyltransferase [Humibacter sp.]|uniref:TIGR04282 family arsenosugar biosynthesis glycosyltransferase n=1 Tax=Humibacter sp. TaxID=1940291 RepID=UPI002CD10DEF|nr:TIGR04282 family arsenosugar biosynthesis glycosyltransferase [Humibacter sp.]HVX07949.1 TIGR04282 family arsenosugar biosynthesis glycosyltransferase [Humibacter sp.]